MLDDKIKELIDSDELVNIKLAATIADVDEVIEYMMTSLFKSEFFDHEFREVHYYLKGIVCARVSDDYEEIQQEMYFYYKSLDVNGNKIGCDWTELEPFKIKLKEFLTN